MPHLGIPELILILVIALFIFGPGKLPDIGRALGRGIKEFRGATREVANEVEKVKEDAGLGARKEEGKA
ncbi:MAG: twin-arginine translocase TatA/TatE family subunit [Firmicutes bacterium]|nr:twin-arginine translocase TatA/TatE family subunit [Bacillota bacterium]MCL5039855.1 twin-arginine translocase TatA/TatE family subunit [Bacillota bacterium]